MEPKKSTAFVFSIGLVAQASRPSFKAAPTLAAGDFKVSIDGGAFNNLASLPTVNPAAGIRVQIALSDAEMNGDNITVQCIDAAGTEWDDVLITIDTSVRVTDDLATPTNITAGTITTVTNLTNAPTAGDLTATMKTSVTTAATAATPTAAAVTGAVGSVTAAVLLSTGTGTGQLDFTAGVVKANLAQILGTALTETAGQIAAAFKKFFNIAAPAATMDHLVLVDTATTTTTAINLTNLPAAAALEATLTAMKGATFAGATDSLEAIRGRGDAAWITATGFATPTNITAATGIVLSGVTHTGAVIPTVTTVGTLTTYTGNTPQTGDTYALANGANGFVATKADTAAILVDTAELQTDWVNGGRLDLILDIIAADTTTDIPALIADLPTNAELATALGTADDAVLAAIPSAATVATAVWAKVLP